MCVCCGCSEGSHLARPSSDNDVFVVPASFPSWPSHAATMVLWISAVRFRLLSWQEEKMNVKSMMDERGKADALGHKVKEQNSERGAGSIFFILFYFVNLNNL